MAAPVQGVLEIQSDPGGQTRIVLDPETADIAAGGNGEVGALILRDAGGVERTFVGTFLRIKNSGGQTAILLNPEGIDVVVGGDGNALRIDTANGTKLLQLTTQASLSIGGGEPGRRADAV